MNTQNKQEFPIPTEEEQAAINARAEKPEGLTPEESQRWDDLENDEKLLKDEGPMAKAFRLYGKGPKGVKGLKY